ncbi:hypothetical protein D1816_01245 [Aquimarina sp. AD10]|uniref:hypothetical protein n=1 Tax=Aquimarina sp. AD10 TaxID=1714849 RepID=UPI000E4B69D0|nr:hypothetical protein [Aquimarina sp. AD10]AXT59032.1 hypothetical protein D1816_01245 [Aquimarina sp. AD10]RKM95127.1 hypothetical protein D7033_17710 [Aquimarina sp. AD10]
MKTIKTLFAIVILSTFFIACEADATNDEIGIEDLDILSNEDEEGNGVEPPNVIKNNNNSAVEDEEGNGVEPPSAVKNNNKFSTEDEEGNGVEPPSTVNNKFSTEDEEGNGVEPPSGKKK